MFYTEPICYAKYSTNISWVLNTIQSNYKFPIRDVQIKRFRFRFFKNSQHITWGLEE